MFNATQVENESWRCRGIGMFSESYPYQMAHASRQRYIPWSWHSRWSNPRIRGEPWAVRPLPAFLFILLTVLSETKGSEMNPGTNIHRQLRGNRAIDADSHTSSGNGRRAYLPVMVLWLTDRLPCEKAQSSLYPPVESTAVSFQVLRSIINDSSSKKKTKKTQTCAHLDQMMSSKGQWVLCLTVKTEFCKFWPEKCEPWVKPI